jgi:UDP-2,4-diacetamido-2,4,6-trideoxy-beta-L-altropyranose hydrolase
LELGIAVDAGPKLGYGHAVRCLRLAEGLRSEAQVIFYPMSDSCEAFLQEISPNFEIRNSKFEIDPLPPLMITDLREPNAITTAIRRQGCRHISIHDLGLGQCGSDVVIDGSITNVFAYKPDPDQTHFLGPEYMITSEPVVRGESTDTVLVTLGGGSTAAFAQEIYEYISRLGMKVVSTRGFLGSARMSDEQLREAMSTCRFAISASGVSLYELLASGVPTIAVAFDRLQLRTTEAFLERGAVLSAGRVRDLQPGVLLACCLEMVENRSMVHRMTRAAQTLVDGKGLSRVVEIVRRELWRTSQKKTFTASSETIRTASM